MDNSLRTAYITIKKYCTFLRKTVLKDKMLVNVLLLTSLVTIFYVLAIYFITGTNLFPSFPIKYERLYGLAQFSTMLQYLLFKLELVVLYYYGVYALILEETKAVRNTIYLFILFSLVAVICTMLAGIFIVVNYNVVPNVFMFLLMLVWLHSATIYQQIKPYLKYIIFASLVSVLLYLLI